MWLMLITIAIGLYLMNEYWIIKEHSCSPQKENRQRFLPLHLFPHLKAIFQPPISKYFSVFFRLPQLTLQQLEKCIPPILRSAHRSGLQSNRGKVSAFVFREVRRLPYVTAGIPCAAWHFPRPYPGDAPHAHTESLP